MLGAVQNVEAPVPGGLVNGNTGGGEACEAIYLYRNFHPLGLMYRKIRWLEMPLHV